MSEVNNPYDCGAGMAERRKRAQQRMGAAGKCTVCGMPSSGHTTRVRQLEREVGWLQAIVDRLPKTADGKLVFVGMRIFVPLPNCRRGDGSSVVLEETVAGIVADGVFTHETISQTTEWGDIYSVYDLAEKARAASEEGEPRGE